MRPDAPAPSKSRQPPMLPGFEHMQRFWDPQIGHWTVKILPGEYFVTQGKDAISTVLGSCISACVRDPVRNVGGMNHFMLPEDASGGPNAWLDPAVGLATRYGSYAMENLINDLLKLGAVRERLEIKVFGGGRVLSGLTDVGARNIAFIRNYVRLEGYRIAAEDLGGTQPRKVVYFPESGLARMRRLRPVENRIISHHEQLYLASIGSKAAGGGDVELFD
ncbi:MAG TPA: chemoreceptor glutamine deamidase CheD [Steroidobacteraceae bacterium]|nr:chemoreceptor glutamine deamidase CheD [Steroidobacteraceae bacterium]